MDVLLHQFIATGKAKVQWTCCCTSSLRRVRRRYKSHTAGRGCEISANACCHFQLPRRASQDPLLQLLNRPDLPLIEHDPASAKRVGSR
jgi:hypothetical protein